MQRSRFREHTAATYEILELKEVVQTDATWPSPELKSDDVTDATSEIPFLEEVLFTAAAIAGASRPLTGRDQ